MTGAEHAITAAAPGLLRLGAAFTLTLLGACDGPSTAPPPDLRLDLTACLGHPDGDGGDSDGGVSACRASLQMAAGADGTPAGCIVIVTGRSPDEPIRHPIVWRAGRVVPAADAVLPLLSGQQVSAALFFGDFGDCDASALGVETPCVAVPRCRHRLGPVDQFIALTGPTVVDFTRGGACVAESNAAPSADAEPCDGVDNDCDGRIDEDIIEPCTAGRGACQAGGDRLRCDEGVRVCADVSGPVIPPASRGPDVECDNVDLDCDGSVDEEADCTCADDGDCATPDLSQCVDGQCRRCDPANDAGCPAEMPQCLADGCHACDPADNAGCDADRPLCDTETRTCRGCATDEECADGQVCTLAGCTVCDPTRPETCPEPDRPVCDGTTYTCRRCRGDGRGDCPTGFCVDGACGGCDPAVGAGDDGACANPSPVCDVRTQTCRGCQNDGECDALDADRPICRDNSCVVCEPGTNTGCNDPAAPVCVTEGGERRCAPCDDAASRRCPFGACVDGRCVACDAANGNGCNVDSPLPFCDDALALGDGIGACRACMADGECPAGRLCDGGRCARCRSADGFGCDENGAAPICRGGNCAACLDDNECTARGGDRNQCVRGRCVTCDPATFDGCARDSAASICNGQSQCVACTAQPAGCGQNGLPPTCNPDGRCVTCIEGTREGCGGNTPFCANNQCRGCRGDGECGPALLCAPDGSCRACLPGTNRGCDPLGAAPVCDGTFTCRGCGQAAECQAIDPARRFCVQGNCFACSPLNNAGCDIDTTAPRCVAGTCQGCGDDVFCAGRPDALGDICLTDGSCRGCDPVDNAGCFGGFPLCDAVQFFCLPCQAGQCPLGACAPDGACVICDPADRGTCVLDVNDPNVAGPPVCDGATRRCVACGQDNQCAGHPYGPECVDGRCACRNNGDRCDLETVTPFCDGGNCRACLDARECDDNPHGNRCVNGACRP